MCSVLAKQMTNVLVKLLYITNVVMLPLIIIFVLVLLAFCLFSQAEVYKQYEVVDFLKAA